MASCGFIAGSEDGSARKCLIKRSRWNFLSALSATAENRVPGSPLGTPLERGQGSSHLLPAPGTSSSE